MKPVKKSMFSLDPRTKLLLIFVESVLVLATAGGDRIMIFRFFFTILPFLLLLTGKKYMICIAGMGILVTTIVLQYLVFPSASGALVVFLRILITLITRFLPAYMMGVYVIRTTKVSEFKAAMERMHIPDELTIPLCVMFRFFPTVREEWGSIRDAMKMRGISLGGGKAGRMLEYRLVPMISCSAQIGEELSASALTRGLGKSRKRTNICQIGFGAMDIFLLLITFGMLLYWFLGVMG